MDVNITLLVQACNFFVAWFLLHKLFFKPALKALDVRQRMHDAVLSRKESWQRYIVAKQQEIAKYWHNLMQFSKQHLPHADRADVPISTQSKQPENPRDEQTAESARTHLVQDIKDKIIAEVYRVEL